MPEIRRSTGIVVPGWYGPSPGGGYEGLTSELDESVQIDAQWLAETYHRDVEIRFNSDRRSGGAFIATGRGREELGLNSAIMRDGSIRHGAIYTSPGGTFNYMDEKGSRGDARAWLLDHAPVPRPPLRQTQLLARRQVRVSGHRRRA